MIESHDATGRELIPGRPGMVLLPQERQREPRMVRAMPAYLMHRLPTLDHLYALGVDMPDGFDTEGEWWWSASAFEFRSDEADPRTADSLTENSIGARLAADADDALRVVRDSNSHAALSIIDRERREREIRAEFFPLDREGMTRRVFVLWGQQIAQWRARNTHRAGAGEGDPWAILRAAIAVHDDSAGRRASGDE